MGRSGLQWSDITGPNRDPLCAMGTVMIIMGVEWIVFLIFSLYLDQVRKQGETEKHDMCLQNLPLCASLPTCVESSTRGVYIPIALNFLVLPHS